VTPVTLALLLVDEVQPLENENELKQYDKLRAVPLGEDAVIDVVSSRLLYARLSVAPENPVVEP
jgi:hypothetical protein